MASLFNFLQSAFSRLLRYLGLVKVPTVVAVAPTAVDYYDPRIQGGSFLNQSGSGGEPLNVIISGRSTPEVLTQSGFLNFARACGMSCECLGLHMGVAQPANLGDGKGWVGEREVLRQHYQLPFLGTCIESLVGGNHFRVYPQDGPNANSGALFLAVSQEEDAAQHHDIIPDGYNVGRDKFVKAAVGTRSYCGITYETSVQDLTGFLSAGAQGVNHGISQDGVVKLLTVSIKTRSD